jgi:4-hydroxythreonine-4-phosphate dehydrogenase
VVKSRKINVGITIGDPNGIGIEIILKSLSNFSLFHECNFVIYASTGLIEKQKQHFQIDTPPLKKIDSEEDLSDTQINVKEVFSDSQFNFGESEKELSELGILSLKEATKAIKDKKIDVLVTAPINKDLSFSESFKYTGHTDFLKNYFRISPLMLMISKELKIALLTDHIPIKDVSNAINQDIVEQKIKALETSLINDFQIKKPKIAVLAVNPHAGDNGVIGNEDQSIITPAINSFKGTTSSINGPFSADTFFVNENYKKYDGIIASYHDQGLIPFKTISFGKGVNFTAGLPFVRTSPDHGTGFDIAGKGIADHTSFTNAIKLGLQVFKLRNNLD